MGEPSYEDLQRKIRELERIVNLKTYPREVCFQTRDLLYFRLDRDWYFEFFDRAILDLTGYFREDFVERKISWMEIVHPEDRDTILRAAESGLRSDKYFTAEFRIVRKRGNVIWVKMRGPIFCDEQGELECIQGILNDISSHKYMEMAFESDREIFTWVADNLDDGIYIVSHDYRIMFMNRALIDLVGNHVGELCYKALFDRDSVCPWSVMDVIRKDKCGFQEYPLKRWGRTFQVRSFPIKAPDGSIGKLGQLKDITQTKKLKSEIQRFTARHQAIEDAANSADLGIFIIQDHEGMEARFRYVNEALCKMTGCTQQDLLSRSMAEVIHPEFVEQAMNRYRMRQRGDKVENVYEMKLTQKDRTPITVLCSVAVSTYDDRIATVGFMRDITDRKRVEKSLWLSQRLASVGKLAAEIAHEINNPMTSVLTFSKLVHRIVSHDPFPESRLEDLKNFAAHLNAEAARCSDIARNLLDFSRQGEIEMKENSLHEILEKTLTILKHRAEMSAIDIVTRFDGDIPPLFCDFKRLQQALVNILWNAIEAMPDGGTLTVSTSLAARPGMVEVEISDTGTGISEADLESVFEPFFTTKSNGKGVGLGLSVAYGIIRQHHGEVQVSSQKGSGTRFTIHLRANGLSEDRYQTS